MLIWFLACTPDPDPVDPPTEADADTDADADVDTDSDTDADTALPDLGDPWITVLGGSFLLGAAPAEPYPNEMPQRRVDVPTFALMQHELRAADYAACVADGACPPAPTGGNCVDDSDPELPQNCLDWASASAACAWMGGRLPSEAEWEFAASARGTHRTYVWGEEPPDCDRANVNQPGAGWSCPGGLWEVCTHPLGDSPLGFCEMAGNAFEWTADWFRGDYVNHPTDGSADTAPDGTFRSMRGGGVGSDEPVRVGHRTFHPPDFYYGGMGVRCAADP